MRKFMHRVVKELCMFTWEPALDPGFKPFRAFQRVLLTNACQSRCIGHHGNYKTKQEISLTIQSNKLQWGSRLTLHQVSKYIRCIIYTKQDVPSYTYINAKLGPERVWGQEWKTWNESYEIFKVILLAIYW